MNQYLLYSNIGYYEMNGTYYIADLNSSEYLVHKDVSDVFAASLTDDNWTNGIMNSNNTEILFCNTKYNRLMLADAISLSCKGQFFKVLNNDMNTDPNWIHITVDKEALECSYPSAITINKE